MGCSGSKAFENVYTIYPALKPYEESFEKLGLTEKEIGKFYENFLKNRIDAGNNCRIKEVVFHMHCNCGGLMTKYWKSVASKPDSGYISFPEYVYGFWNLLTLRPLQKSYDRFTFDLYADKNGKNKGILTANTAKTLLDEVYGSKKDFIYKKAVKNLTDPKTPTTFTLQEWNEFTVRNEGVLMPLQDLLNKERFKLMGKPYWERKMDARKNFSRGKSYLTLTETLAVTGISSGNSGALSTSIRHDSMSRKPSKRATMGHRSNSQATLMQGGSSNSISIDG